MPSLLSSGLTDWRNDDEAEADPTEAWYCGCPTVDEEE
jgi:hypothetical protein